jgi:prolipoprotein diacylglyceryltransferase
MMIHLTFDILAITTSIGINKWFRQRHKIKHPLLKDEENYYWYLLTAIVGLFVGAFLFGSLNLYFSGHENIGKSFAGGIFGAIFAIEIFKHFKGYQASTGLYYIAGLCVLIIIGRLGCFFSGLDDYTYGIETQSPFAYDYGDGLKRHPVQLYEIASILIFFVFFLSSYNKHKDFWLHKGFYLFILVYASQRFIWEFFKPYASLFLHLNLFHLLTLILIIWSSIKLKS